MAFTFIQITDHHLRETAEQLTFGYSTDYAFRTVMSHIAANNAARADFMVMTGDLVDKGTDAEYARARQVLGLRDSSAPPGPQQATFGQMCDMPMYFLPGNHDPRAIFFRNMFPGTDAGDPPRMNAAFSHKGIQFVCIDWGESNIANLEPAMLDFLQQKLAADQPTIILTHHNVAPLGVPKFDAFIAAGIERFSEAISGHNVLAIFCGHLHTTYEVKLAGIPVYGLRSTTFTLLPDGDRFLYVLRPPHYRVVTVEEEKVSTEIVEVAL